MAINWQNSYFFFFSKNHLIRRQLAFYFGYWKSFWTKFLKRSFSPPTFTIIYHRFRFTNIKTFSKTFYYQTFFKQNKNPKKSFISLIEIQKKKKKLLYISVPLNSMHIQHYIFFPKIKINNKYIWKRIQTAVKTIW